MKRVLIALATGLLSGQALAADLPMPAPPPRAAAAYVPIITPFSWTGIYVGGNAGAAWNRGTVSDAAGNSFTLPSTNAVFTGGGQVGGNWQINVLVLGVEGQFDWLANQNNASAGIAVPAGAGTTNTLQVISKDRWLTTLTGRIGVAADHWLFYGKGGVAWVGNQSFTVNNVTTGQSFTNSSGSWNTGWTVGGGIEWAFAGPWSVKLEYDYIRLTSSSFTVPTPSPVGVLAGDVFTTGNRNIQTALIGINYRFGAW
jgi:outer membrane immunogenic protein